MASSTTSDKEIGQIPSALRVAGPTALLLCCSSSPMPYIDSSSRLQSEPFRPQQMACYSWDRTLVGTVCTMPLSFDFHIAPARIAFNSL